jgi:hypothetical protein
MLKRLASRSGGGLNRNGDYDDREKTLPPGYALQGLSSHAFTQLALERPAALWFRPELESNAVAVVVAGPEL